MTSPIPVTAGTYGFTPEILREFVPEGEDLFVLRHATRKDHVDREFLKDCEGLIAYPEDRIRQAIINELKSDRWKSEDQARGITQIEAYWQAADDWRESLRLYASQVAKIRSEAAEGEEIKLPDIPVLDFDPGAADAIEMQLAEVQSMTPTIAKMNALNKRFLRQTSILNLRMLMVSTTLDVTPARSAGVITSDSAEVILTALNDLAMKHGDDKGKAMAQLLIEAQRALTLTEDEEKNSSSPGPGSTARKPSAKSSASPDASRSKRTKTSAKDTG